MHLLHAYVMMSVSIHVQDNGIRVPLFVVHKYHTHKSATEHLNAHSNYK